MHMPDAWYDTTGQQGASNGYDLVRFPRVLATRRHAKRVAVLRSGGEDRSGEQPCSLPLQSGSDWSQGRIGLGMDCYGVLP